MNITSLELNPFTPAGWGGKAVLQLPLGPTYHEFALETNLTAAQIERVSLVLKGNPIISLRGTDLAMLEQYRKRYTTTGWHMLYLADIMGSTPSSRNISALVTTATDHLTLEVEIGQPAAGQTTATPITLKAWAEVSAPQAVRVFLPRKYVTTIQALQTTNNVWGGISRGPALQRVHFLADLPKLSVHKDNVKVWERSKGYNVYQQNRMDRAPQPNVCTCDFVESDYNVADMMPTNDVRSTFEFKYDAPAVGAIEVIVESLEQVAEIAA